MKTIFEHLIRCAYCEGRMQKRPYKPVTEGATEIDYFRCIHRTGAEKNDCTSRPIAYRPMEVAIFAQVVDTTPLERPVPNRQRILEKLEYQNLTLIKHVRDPSFRDYIVPWLKEWIATTEALEEELQAAIAADKELEESAMGGNDHVRAGLAHPHGSTLSEATPPLKNDVERIWVATYINERPTAQKHFGVTLPQNDVCHFAEIWYRGGTKITAKWL